MGRRKIGVICGGSGSSKFVTALTSHFHDSGTRKSLAGFVLNVADNFWHHGLYICPDVDIIMYALSKKLDTSKGWGVRSDTFNFLNAYGEISGEKEWFNLGDKDLATSIRRTEMIKQGWTLSQITDFFRDAIGITYRIVPATNDHVETYIKTPAGTMNLQEFWVKNKGRPNAIGVEYSGIKFAHANQGATRLCNDTAIICPANPVTSILPTVNLLEFKKVLRRAKVVAISPFLRREAFSGPAAKLMRAIGVEASSSGVAGLYSSFLKILLVDRNEDSKIIKNIKDLGVDCIKAKIAIKNKEDQKMVAKEIVDAL